jgi:hypothetical protein
MKKILIILIFTIFTFGAAKAQYNLGVGVRLGYNPGISLKKSLGAKSYAEGILSSNGHGFLLTGLYQIHNSFLDEPKLNWFYGAGGHFGAWDKDHKHHFLFHNEGEVAIGVDGILGLEYALSNAPFCLALDWKPSFNIVSQPGLYVGSGAFTIRFIL